MEKKENTEKDKWGLDCSYYKNTYDSLDDLLQAIKDGGMDPNYEITKNGEGVGETAADHLIP